MSETALKLRSPNFKSFKVTAPSAGYTAGQMVKIGDTVGVIVDTKTVGLDTALIYQCEKIVVPKEADVMAKGVKVYFKAGTASVTTTASGNTLCGRVNVAAAASDSEVEIDLEGNIAA